MKKITSFSDYVARSTKWSSELRALRKILTVTELAETIKWGAPCYTYKGKNVVSMASFTEYFGLWFHQGATLQDTSNKLINAQEGKTKALRQWRMTSVNDIKPTIIKRYIKESIANIDQGVEIKIVRKKSVPLAPELKTALARNRALKTAFGKLSPGKQREYSLYISDAKQVATKEQRIQKSAPLILAGQGLNDRYR